MKTFTYSDMNRTPGEILDIALVEPVMLTKRGKGKLVVMSAVDFDILKHGRAFATHDMPDAVREFVLDALDYAEEMAGDENSKLNDAVKPDFRVAAE